MTMSNINSGKNSAPYSWKFLDLRKFQKHVVTCWKYLTRVKSNELAKTLLTNEEQKLLQNLSKDCCHRSEERGLHVEIVNRRRFRSIDSSDFLECNKKTSAKSTQTQNSNPVWSLHSESLYSDSGIEIAAHEEILCSTLIASNIESAVHRDPRRPAKEFWQQSCRIRSTELCNDSENKFNLNGMLLENCRIREKYPHLDAEVRGILMLHAGGSATIAEIQDEYRKIVGTDFPAMKNILQFMVSIPHVHIFSDRGQVRYRLVPSDKTKHLYDLIAHQKPSAPSPMSVRSKHIQYHPRLNQYNRQNEPHNSVYYRCNGKTHPHLNENQETQEIIIDNVDKESSLWPQKSTNDAYQNNCTYINKRIYNENRQADRSTISYGSISCGNKRRISESNDTHLGIESCKTYKTYNDYNNNNNNNNTMINDNNNKNLQYRSTYLPDKISKNCENMRRNLVQSGRIEMPPPLVALSETSGNQQQQQLNNNSNAINYNKRSKPNYLKPWYRPTSIGRSSSPRSSSQFTESCYFSECESEYDARLLEFPFLGDDFLLYLARMELHCKFKRNVKPYQSGLCVSGQTIGAAIDRVQRQRDARKRIIVNIGTVDILQGRSLLKIQHDFRNLINLMHKKGFTPILTTLAPLANYAHVGEFKERLEGFNNFIKRTYKFLTIIDIWTVMTNNNGQIRFDCYQNDTRKVTGSDIPHVFWNKIGRQRILKLIENSLEY